MTKHQKAEFAAFRAGWYANWDEEKGWNFGEDWAEKDEDFEAGWEEYQTRVKAACLKGRDDGPTRSRIGR